MLQPFFDCLQVDGFYPPFNRLLFEWKGGGEIADQTQAQVKYVLRFSSKKESEMTKKQLSKDFFRKLLEMLSIMSKAHVLTLSTAVGEKEVVSHRPFPSLRPCQTQ